MLGQFTRDVMGSPHVDVAGREEHAAGDRAMLKTLGDWAVTNSKAELIDAKMFLLVGTNMPETHPVLSYDIHIAMRTRDARMVIIAPQWNNLCEVATVWLQVRPGTETVALLAMANVITRENLHAASFIAERVDWFDAWQPSIREMTPERAAAICGVEAADIERAARLYAKGGFSRNPAPADSGLYPPSAAFFGSGITNAPGGEEAATAVINLALLTGNVGRAGAGVWPLRDGTNHQGALDVDCIPGEGGFGMTEMIAGAESGAIRAMLISALNPAGEADEKLAARSRAALEKLDFLVVHDLFLTETAQLADVVLPAPTWTEVSGTLTNVDRHVQLLRPGADPDWREPLALGCAERPCGLDRHRVRLWQRRRCLRCNRDGGTGVCGPQPPAPRLGRRYPVAVHRAPIRAARRFSSRAGSIHHPAARRWWR